MERGRKSSAFTMKSGNKTTFKMMGASPLKNDPPDNVKTDFTTAQYIEQGEGYKKAKSGSRKNLADRLSKRYNTTITKKDGVFSDPEGRSVADLEKVRLDNKEITASQK